MDGGSSAWVVWASVDHPPMETNAPSGVVVGLTGLLLGSKRQ
jgi:hypothetical protein